MSAYLEKRFGLRLRRCIWHCSISSILMMKLGNVTQQTNTGPTSEGWLLIFQSDFGGNTVVKMWFRFWGQTHSAAKFLFDWFFKWIETHTCSAGHIWNHFLNSFLFFFLSLSLFKKRSFLLFADLWNTAQQPWVFQITDHKGFLHVNKPCILGDRLRLLTFFGVHSFSFLPLAVRPHRPKRSQ